MLPFSTISVKQLMTLKCCCYNTARRHLQHLRDALQIDVIQARHLAKYWDCSVQELADALRPTLKK
jgi:hypothetical protein